MIEIVSNDRCIKCGICAKICPTNVFGPEPIPTIARQEDCQTCFACEAYCPVDAIYVSPFRHPTVVNEKTLIELNQFGLYRSMLGWKKLGENIKIRMLKEAILKTNNYHKLQMIFKKLSLKNLAKIKKLLS